MLSGQIKERCWGKRSLIELNTQLIKDKNEL